VLASLVEELFVRALPLVFWLVRDLLDCVLNPIPKGAKEPPKLRVLVRPSDSLSLSVSDFPEVWVTVCE